MQATRHFQVVWAGSHTVISPSLRVFVIGDLATKSAALQEAVTELIGGCLWFGEVKAVVASINKELTLSPASWKPYFAHYRKKQSATRSVFDFNQQRFAAQQAAWKAVAELPSDVFPVIVVTRYPAIESAVEFIASGKSTVAWHRYAKCSKALQCTKQVAAAALDAGMSVQHLNDAVYDYPSIVVKCIQQKHKRIISQPLLHNKQFVELMLATFVKSELETRCVFPVGVARPDFVQGQVFYDCVMSTGIKQLSEAAYTRAEVLERVQVYGEVVLLHKDFLNDNKIVVAAIKSSVSKDLFLKLTQKMRYDISVVVAAANAGMRLVASMDMKRSLSTCEILAHIEAKKHLAAVYERFAKEGRTNATAIVASNGLLLQHMCLGNRNDKQIVLAACKSNGLALQFASPALKRCRNVVLAACKSNGLALEFASDELQGCRGVVLAACKSNGNALKHANIQFHADREVVLAACRSSATALKFSSEAMRRDKTIVMAAIKFYNRQSIKNSESPYYKAIGGLMVDTDVLLAACKSEPHLIHRLPAKQENDMNFVLKAATRTRAVLHGINDDALRGAADKKTRVLRCAAANWQMFVQTSCLYEDVVQNRVATRSELNAAAASGFKNAVAAAADCLGYTTLNAIKLLSTCNNRFNL